MFSVSECIKDFKKGDKAIIILPYVDNGKQLFCCRKLEVRQILTPPKRDWFVDLKLVKEISPLPYNHFYSLGAESSYHDILFYTNTVKNEDVTLLCAPFLVTDEDAESYMNLVNKWNKYGVSKTDNLFAVITETKGFIKGNEFLAKFSLAK